MEPLEQGKPLQLIRCGDADDNYAFVLNDENLVAVTSKVPKGMRVAVVSVVGAFRTGKSFLLTLILRYLRHKTSGKGDGVDWLTMDGDSIAEGNVNEGGTGGAASFEWRGGRVRMTTGITVWSEPFVMDGADGLPIAVIILDTQGLFDNETPMGLTSCIFGLSTLMSSYQIYNVSNRIQEDNLQQLALFTEYGRMAVEAQKMDTAAAAQKAKPTATKAAAEPTGTGPAADGEETTTAAAESAAKPAAAGSAHVPFQRLEFLVRDWSEFDEEMSDSAMEEMMATYLEEVLSPRAADDLAFTREQITLCFEKLTCRLLPHPGFAVTKKNYDGEIAKLEPLFTRCATGFMGHVFGELDPKRINDESLTALELANYVRAYVAMFRDGARFPQATTMLEATADANNRNAAAKAADTFAEIMDVVCGHKNKDGFVAHVELKEKMNAAMAKAMEQFTTVANMGRASAVDATREKLQKELDDMKKRYVLMNDARNPFKNAEFYVIPIVIASMSYVVRKFTDAVCPEDGSTLAQTCNRVEHSLEQVYCLVMFLMLLSCYQRFKGLFKHMKSILQPILMQALTVDSPETK